MAKAMNGMKGQGRHHHDDSDDVTDQDGGRRRAPAPAKKPKPGVPVAVVHGKRSLKKAAGAFRNRFFVHSSY